MLLPRQGELVAVKAPTTSMAFPSESYVSARPCGSICQYRRARGHRLLLHRDLPESLTATFDLDDGFAVVEAHLWAPARFDQDTIRAESPSWRPRFARGRPCAARHSSASVLALRVRR